MGQVMSVLIEKEYDHSDEKDQVFSTADDNQTAVTIHVLQGERKQAGHKNRLADLICRTFRLRHAGCLKSRWLLILTLTAS